MTPIRNRFAVVPPPVDDPPRGPRGYGRERAAGLVAIDRGATRPQSLPSRANFSRSVESDANAAYWMIGEDLYIGSPAQVLRDARQELGIGEGVAQYTVGMIERVSNAAQTRIPGIVLPAALSPGDGNTFPMRWFRLLLWVVYADPNVADDQVRLPVQWVLPTFGGSVWTNAAGMVRSYQSFDASLLAANPFVAGGGGFTVTGYDRPPTPSTTSNNNALWLAVVGVAILAGSK